MFTFDNMRIFSILLLAALLFSNLSQSQTLQTNFPQPNGMVYAISKIGQMVYIGGGFTEVNGQPRTCIARFDATTGALDSWSPDVSGFFNTKVENIALAGNKLVVAGNFDTINGQARNHMCVFDLATGNLDAWSGNPLDSWKQGFGVKGNIFFYPIHVGTTNVVRVVAADATTGAATGWETSDIQNVNYINTIITTNDYLYIGGSFSMTVGSVLLGNVARFDIATGQVDTSWHPVVLAASWGVTELIEDGNLIWIGGKYSSIDGEARQGIAAVDVDGNLKPFNPTNSANEVYALFSKGDHIWIGANAWQLGGQARWRVAELDKTTAGATCWNASSTSSSWGWAEEILVLGDTVFVAGTALPSLHVFVGNPRPQVDASDVTGPLAVSPGQSATYSVPNTPGFTYSWAVIGGTGSSSTNSIDVTWGSGPTGSLKLVVGNPGGGLDCNSDTIELEIQIESCDVLYTTTYSAADNTFYLVLDSASSAGSASFVWDFGDGSTSGLAFPSHVYAVDGLYSVCVLANYSGGLSCQHCDTIGIDSLGNPVFRIDDDGFAINVVPFGTIIGVMSVSAADEGFYVYPNPTFGSVFIKGLDPNEPVSIVDYTGRTIKVVIGNAGQFELDHLSAGIYFVKARNRFVRVAKL